MHPELLSDGVSDRDIETRLLLKGILKRIRISFIGELSCCKGVNVLIDAAFILRELSLKNDFVFLIPRDLLLLRDKQKIKEEYLRNLRRLICEDIAVTYPTISYKFMSIFL